MCMETSYVTFWHDEKRLLVSQLAFVQAEAFHLLVERRAVNAQLVGSQIAVPIVNLQHVENNLTFWFFQSFFQRAANCSTRCGVDNRRCCQLCRKIGRRNQI